MRASTTQLAREFANSVFACRKEEQIGLSDQSGIGPARPPKPPPPPFAETAESAGEVRSSQGCIATATHRTGSDTHARVCTRTGVATVLAHMVTLVGLCACPSRPSACLR